MISFDPLTIHDLTLVCVASIPKMKISWATAIDITKCSLICVSPALRFLKTCKKKKRERLPGYSLFSFFVVAFFGVGGRGVGECGRLPPPTLLIYYRIENFLFLQSSQIYLQKNYECHNCDEFSHQREGTADIVDQF